MRTDSKKCVPILMASVSHGYALVRIVRSLISILYNIYYIENVENSVESEVTMRTEYKNAYPSLVLAKSTRTTYAYHTYRWLLTNFCLIV